MNPWKNPKRYWLDITTYCNADCPQCARSDYRYHDHINEVEPMNMDMDTVTNIDFTIVESVIICGSHGDPIMHPYIKEIVGFISSFDNIEKIHIDTNGSIRNTNWWKRFAVYKKLRIAFAIDGIDQKMHEKYRVGTNLEKVKSNVKSFTEAGGKAEIKTIKFKHNENYIDEIGNIFPDLHHNHTPTYHEIGLEENNLEMPNDDSGTYSIAVLRNKECWWGDEKMVTISSLGRVLPCCYMNAYDQGINRLDGVGNINENTFDEIMDQPFWDFIKSWETNNPNRICKDHCNKGL